MEAAGSATVRLAIGDILWWWPATICQEVRPFLSDIHRIRENRKWPGDGDKVTLPPGAEGRSPRPPYLVPGTAVLVDACEAGNRGDWAYSLTNSRLLSIAPFRRSPRCGGCVDQCFVMLDEHRWSRVLKNRSFFGIHPVDRHFTCSPRSATARSPSRITSRWKAVGNGVFQQRLTALGRDGALAGWTRLRKADFTTEWLFGRRRPRFLVGRRVLPWNFRRPAP